MQNKQQQQQEQTNQHLKRNGYQSKTNYRNKEDYIQNDRENTDNLSRGLSLESYNSFYEADRNSWPHNKKQQIKFEGINNLQQAYGGSNLVISKQTGSRSGRMSDGPTVNGLNGQHLNVATTKTYQHISYNNDSYETHLTHNHHHDDVEPDDNDDDDDTMTKTALASNKTYKKFVLPLDIPTPPLPLSYNTTKRLLSSHNHSHYTPTTTSCQCDKQTNFAKKNSCNSNNIKTQVNHISFIQTTQNQAAVQATTPTSKKENLTLLHNKGSSSSSTLSGSIGCSGLNFNVSDQHHLPHHEPLQHHHLCQQKNLKLQHATLQHQHQHHHHHQQHHNQQQQQHLQPQCQQKLQHQPSLPSYDAYASQQQYLPQLPQLLSVNSNNNNNNNNYQQNSLTLSHRRMAPTFNRIADKNYMKVSRFWFFQRPGPLLLLTVSASAFLFPIWCYFCFFLLLFIVFPLLPNL